jgi:predicted HicB family RNase H-like nuclease
MTNKNDALKQALNAENEQTLTPAQIKNKQLLKSNTEAHETKSQRVTILVKPSIKKELDEIAESNRISRNELINVVLCDYVAGKLQPTDAVAPRDIPLYDITIN